jgi:hypothetical protein
MVDRDPFEAAYVEYLAAVKRAWAEVDIDALSGSLEFRRGQACQGCQGCGVGFGSIGTFGTLGCIGTIGGTFGHAATAGTFGSAGPGLTTQQALATAAPIQSMGTAPPPLWLVHGYGGSHAPSDQPHGGERGEPT